MNFRRVNMLNIRNLSILLIDKFDEIYSPWLLLSKLFTLLITKVTYVTLTFDQVILKTSGIVFSPRLIRMWGKKAL